MDAITIFIPLPTYYFGFGCAVGVLGTTMLFIGMAYMAGRKAKAKQEPK